MGIHWKSKTTIGNFPLIHVAIGLNDKGKSEEAHGVIAIGGFATGVIALGVFNAKGVIAVGVLGAMGVISAGLLSIGAISAGIFALGIVTIALWCGIGLIAGIGHIIAAPICCGFGALGIVAVGGYTLGVFVNGIKSTWGIFGVGDGWHLYEYDWLHRLGIESQQVEAVYQYEEHMVRLLIKASFALPMIIPDVVISTILWFVFTRFYGAVIYRIRVMAGLAKIEETVATILECRKIGVNAKKPSAIELHIEYVTLAGRYFKVKIRTSAGDLTPSKFEPGATITIAYDSARPGRPIIPRPEMNAA